MLIQQHLLKCLEECKLSRFPVAGERRHRKAEYRADRPSLLGFKMAQCDSCEVWYHQHCMDILGEVFGDSEVSWVCKKCKR